MGGTPMSDLADDAAALTDLKRVLDGSVDAAIILDQDHHVLYRNAAYDAYTGRKPRDVARLAQTGTLCHQLFNLEICAEHCIMRRAVQARKPLRMHEIHARRGDGEELTLIVTSTPLGNGLVLEQYRDVTAESRVQRKYHTLLARERNAKEELERKVSERTEALKRAQDQLVLNEKMSSLGRLVAGIAHELNNPINFVYGNVDFLAQYFRYLIGLLDVYETAKLPTEVRQAAEEYKKAIDFEFLLQDWEKLLKSVRAGAERTAQIVAGLKAFSRPQIGRLEEHDVIAGIETTLSLLQPLMRDNITVQKKYQAVPRIRCRGGQVQQVFMNLLTNAAQAAGPGGEIFISVWPLAEGVNVSIRDSGPGVSPEVESKIFDPFFTTKEVGEGTGLGLAISQRIVRSHGGHIELAPRQAGRTGAEFIVWLPKEPPERVIASDSKQP
jgi:two-component system, NtrC family, sensor kinase